MMSEPPRSISSDAVTDSGRASWIDVACFLRRYEPDQVRRVCGVATLSARRALPGGGVRLCRKRSTRAEPADDVVEDGGPLRFVVQLVAKARVRPPLDAGRALEHLGGRGRDEPVVETVQDQRRPADRPRAGADTGLLGERLGAEPGGAGPDVQRIGGRAPTDLRIARQRLGPRCRSRSTGSGRACRGSAPGVASTRPASSRGPVPRAPSGPAAAGRSAGSPPRRARPSNGRTARPAGRRRRRAPPPGAPRGRRGSDSSGRCHRAGHRCRRSRAGRTRARRGRRRRSARRRARTGPTARRARARSGRSPTDRPRGQWRVRRPMPSAVTTRPMSEGIGP